MEFFLIKTNGTHKLFLVVSQNPFYDITVDLPAGTYYFYEIPNPINPGLGSWLRLVNTQTHLPQVKKKNIVGIGKTYFLHWAKSRSPFGDMSYMEVDMEVVYLTICETTRVAPPHVANPRRRHCTQPIVRLASARRLRHPAGRRTYAVG